VWLGTPPHTPPRRPRTTSASLLNPTPRYLLRCMESSPCLVRHAHKPLFRVISRLFQRSHHMVALVQCHRAIDHCLRPLKTQRQIAC
jgi:hypothetical protein